ncbi:DUF4278 domain-containing protein [Nodosilinea nodulosa]|uniref:DUF4278 domain-containing protein n=1 Tax=Nodosilinea nodulosa TaxID=416001 RepID=UPI0003039339|nr:DUF4278 domain-containing protein [Nodosilinea nodulosa]
MSLKYRGINYEVATSDLHVSEEVIGRYRGAVVTRHLATGDRTETHTDGLKYRGAVVR